MVAFKSQLISFLGPAFVWSLFLRAISNMEDDALLLFKPFSAHFCQKKDYSETSDFIVRFYSLTFFIKLIQ